MKDRSYNQYCALAIALDVIGERWTLLIIRELLAGPRRFKDLVDGLPGISTNLLAERLKSLEQQRILYRRTLPPPAGSTVYDLTPLGRALEKPMIELGKWGGQLLLASVEKDFQVNSPELPSVGAISLALKAFFRPEQARTLRQTYLLCLGDETLTVQIQDGEIQVQPSETQNADTILRAPMHVFVDLFAGRIEPEEAVEAGLIQIEGDTNALARFLSCTWVQAGEGRATV